MNYKKRTTSKLKKMYNNKNKRKRTKKHFTSLNSYKDRLSVGGDANPNTNLAEKMTTLTKGLTEKSIVGLGNMLGVNLSDPKNISQKLDLLRTSFADPENIAKLKSLYVTLPKGIVVKTTNGFIEGLANFLQVNLSDEKKTDESFKEIQNKLNDINTRINILQIFKSLPRGFAVKQIEKLGKYLDVDLSDKKNIDEKIDKMIAALNLNDPIIKQKLSKLTNEFAKVGEVAVDAVNPVFKKFTDNTVGTLTDASHKISKSAVKVATNALTAIPGVGTPIALAKTVDNLSDVIASASAASKKIMADTSESIDSTQKNFAKLMNEKTQSTNNSLQRINNAIEDYKKPQINLSSKKPNTK